MGWAEAELTTTSESQGSFALFNPEKPHYDIGENIFKKYFNEDISTKNLLDSNTSTCTTKDITTVKHTKLFISTPSITFRETILEWFKGTVCSINYEDHFFSADMLDLEGRRSVAEFDFETVFESIDEAKNTLFRGQNFVFSVVKRHSTGSPSIVSSLEFMAAKLWKNSYKERAQNIYRDLFDEDW